MKLYQFNLFTQIISLSLLVVPAIIQVEIFPFTVLIQSRYVSQRPEPLPEEGREGGSQLRQLWHQFFPRSEPIPEEGSDGGSKGDGFCPISP